MANFVQNYNGGVQFKTGASQGLTVDINGNIGVGITSPTTNLHIGSGTTYQTTGYNSLGITNTTIPAALELSTSGNTSGAEIGSIFFTNQSSAISGRGIAQIKAINGSNSASGNLLLFTQGGSGLVERMRIDSSGNVGIGVIPSTWNNSQKVIQVANSSFYGYGTAGVSAGTIVGQNFFYDGQSRYISSGPASQTTQTNGAFNFYNAPSGIAGATTTITSGQVYTVTVLGASTLAQWQAFFSALSVLPTVGQSITATATGTLVGGGTVTQVITFNNAMTLDASGRLGVGTSNTSGFRLSTYGKGTTGNVWGDNLVQFVDSTPNETGLRIAVNAATSGLTQLVASTNSAASQFGFWTYNGTSWGERARIDSSGNVQIGTTSASATRKLNVAGNIGLGITAETGIGWRSSDFSGSYGEISMDMSSIMRFYTGASERMRIDANGNLLLTSGTGALGYGTGAGGTVTQLTSKSTAVTLNKPTGKITMTADALAAGASVTFLVNNSILTATDIVYPAIIGGIADATAYRLELVASISGMCRFRLTNISAGSLSEAVQIQFIVIKGAIA